MYIQDLIDDEGVIRDLLAIRGFHDLYFAGGAVRDALLDHRTLDLDIACRGLLGDVKAYFEHLGAPVFTREDYHALHVKRGHYTLTFTHLRRDDPDGRVEKASLAEDALRRDFTVNALYFQILPTGELLLIDRVGGLNDLSRKRLRPVSPSTFFDDPSRFVRALRYHHQLGFAFDPGFLSRMQEHRWKEVDFTAAIDRIYSELQRTELTPFLSRIRTLGLQGIWPMRADGLSIDRVAYFMDHLGEFLSDPFFEGITDDAFRRARKKYLNFLSRYSTLDRNVSVALIRLLGTLPEEELVLYARLLDDDLIRRYIAHRATIERRITGSDLLALGYTPGPALGRALEEVRARLLADPTLDREILLSTLKEGT